MNSYLNKLNTKTSQQLVLNVLEYFELEKVNGGPLEPFSSVQQRVAAALKISRRTVCTIIKRKENNHILSKPSKSRPRRKNKTTDLSEGSKMAVRNTVYDMYQQKKHVTLQSISNELRDKEVASWFFKRICY
ncbi:uncharacterized protein [Diabrotica undecimpunctata]|uniref:uncharacterized protein n=1 Tax=Diabrotica undecimpunctata TaxID=50387 RepID=UPI003B63445E